MGKNIINNNKTGRFMELEGLRGVAAIVVVVFHAILMFYPGFFYGRDSYGGLPMQNMRFEDNFYANPVMGLLTGSFSVAIFFVLSGFVLSIGFLDKGDSTIIKRLALKRYIRLMLPALAAILFSYFIIQLGLDVWRGQAAEITHSAWLASLWPQDPNFYNALIQGIYGAFVSGDVSYNPVLWTVKYEFVGSFIVFGVALLFAGSKYRWIVYGILSFIFFTTWYLGFILGMMLADLYISKKEKMQKIPSWILVVGVVLGVSLGAFPPTDLSGTLFQNILIPGLTHAQNISVYLTIAASLVILATLLLPRMKNFFSHQRIAPLGKYTFSLYLVHMPILFSLGAGMFVAANDFVNFHWSVVISMIVTFLIMVPVTYMFERYIDAPSIRLSSILADIYSGARVFSVEIQKCYVSLKALYIAINKNFIIVLNTCNYKTIKAKYMTPQVIADEDNE